MTKRFFSASFLGLLVAATAAHATTISYNATGSDGDGPVSASATITTGLNSLVVSLSSLIANPTAAGQEVSGIFIALSNSLTTASLTSATGTLINIGSGGTVTPNNGTIGHWGTSVSATHTICLETAGTCAVGGKPVDLIIGPGPYTNANPSITGRNPQIQNTGTFNLTVAGLTAGTTITGVTFEFGTGPDYSLAGTPVTAATPEPSSLALLGTGVLGAAGILRRRIK